MNGNPKPAFYIAVGLVVVGLIAFAVYRADIFAPPAKAPGGGGPIDPKELGGGPGTGGAPIESHAESPDAQPQLMAKEYTLRPRQERLPDPAGAADYEKPAA